MRAGLLAGSFSPIDFYREFQSRHGVRPEDANRPWHSCQSSRESSVMTNPYDQQMEPQFSEITSPALPPRGMEVIRTHRVAREQEYAEREVMTLAYAVARNFDIRLMTELSDHSINLRLAARFKTTLSGYIKYNLQIPGIL